MPRFVYVPAHPELVQQDGQFAGDSRDRPLLCPAAAAPGDREPPSAQIAVRAKGAENVVRTLNEKAPQKLVASFVDAELWIALTGLILTRPQAQISSDFPACFETF